MQTMVVNNTPAQMGMTSAAATTATPNGEDFLAMMMGLMQGGGQSTDEMQALLDGMLPQSGKGKDETQTSEYAMQMMAGLFEGLPNGLPSELIGENPLGYSDGVTAANQSQLAQIQQMLMQSSGQQGYATAAQMQQLLNAAAQQEGTAQVPAAKPTLDAAILLEGAKATQQNAGGAKTDTGDANTAAISLATLSAAAGTGTANGAQTGTGYGDAQQSGQDKLTSSIKLATGGAAESADVEALQAAVDGGRYLQQTGRTAEIVTTGTAANLVAQVKAGVISNLNQDKSEFTIKLKPEGMGEITVKMVENGGKISLSLITSSAHTQSLLSGEIGSLREALRPYNTEVQQIVSQPQTELQQGMGEHQHNNGQQQNGQQNTVYNPWQEQEAEQETQGYSSVLSSVLHAYV